MHKKFKKICQEILPIISVNFYLLKYGAGPGWTRLTMDWYLLTQETLKYRSVDWLTIHKTEHFTEQIILTKWVT